MSVLELALDRNFLIFCFVVLFLILFGILVGAFFCVCDFVCYFWRLSVLDGKYVCHLVFKAVYDCYFPIQSMSDLISGHVG